MRLSKKFSDERGNGLSSGKNHGSARESAQTFLSQLGRD
jgi:hypothetical protein